jgi:hypothetical protein
MIANREAHLGAIVDAIRACSGDAVLLGGAPPCRARNEND